MFAAALPLLALVAILWSVPSTFASIAIAVVVARVAVALGLLAVCVAFLHAGGRFLAASAAGRVDLEKH